MLDHSTIAAGGEIAEVYIEVEQQEDACTAVVNTFVVAVASFDDAGACRVAAGDVVQGRDNSLGTCSFLLARVAVALA